MIWEEIGGPAFGWTVPLIKSGMSESEVDVLMAPKIRSSRKEAFSSGQFPPHIIKHYVLDAQWQVIVVFTVNETFASDGDSLEVA